MMLALVVWLGALIFFPVVAHTAFSVFPTRYVAGLMVRNSLIVLHWMGMISGVIFLASSLLYERLGRGQLSLLKIFRPCHIFLAVMLALTMFSQFRIIPSMDELRLSVGEIASLPASDPRRTQFDSLHVSSTHFEEAVLLLGLIVLYSTSWRLSRTISSRA